MDSVSIGQLLILGAIAVLSNWWIASWPQLPHALRSQDADVILREDQVQEVLLQDDVPLEVSQGRQTLEVLYPDPNDQSDTVPEVE